jgi:predicted ArsR family transcriptional regulator
MNVTKESIMALGISRPEANGFINGLVACGAVKAGTRPKDTPGKGRTATVYTLTPVQASVIPEDKRDACEYTGEVIVPVTAEATIIA